MKTNFKCRIIILLFLLCPAIVWSGTADISWNHNSESDLNAYRVYIGTASRDYNSFVEIDKGLNSYRFTNLDENYVYYFAITAVDTSGNESGFSSEVSKTFVATTPVGIGNGTDNGEVAINIVKPSNYIVSTLSEPITSVTVHIDRNYTFLTMPSKYIGLQFIKTVNDDRRSVSEDFLTFSVSTPVTVYVGYQKGATSYPSWLTSNFTKNGDEIERTYATWEVWQRDYPAGQITLGGNLSQNDSSYYAMYTVIIKGNSTGAEADTTAPVVSIGSPTTGTTHSTTSSSVSLSGTATDNIGVSAVTWSNSRGGSGTASGTSSWSIGGISLSSGENIITVQGVDAAGNRGTDTLTVTYNLSDTTAPVLNVLAPTTGTSYYTRQSSITISGTASDNVGVTRITWSNNKGGSGVATGTNNWKTSTISLSRWTTNIITITAFDQAGNKKEYRLSVFRW